MAFFNSAVTVLQTLVIALGAGLGIWGAINLLEGYGNDNPGANAYYHGFDTYGREQDVAAMFEYPESSGELFEKYGVDYIYIGINERCNYSISPESFENLEKVFSNGTATLYRYSQ